MKSKSPILSLGVAALSAYGTYYLAERHLKPVPYPEFHITPPPPPPFLNGGSGSNDEKDQKKTPGGNQTNGHAGETDNNQIAGGGAAGHQEEHQPKIPQTRVDPDLVQRVTDRMDHVASEAHAQRTWWETKRERLRSGMQLRSEVEAQLAQMKSSLESAQSALRLGDPAAADKYLDTAEVALASLKKAAG